MNHPTTGKMIAVFHVFRCANLLTFQSKSPFQPIKSMSSQESFTTPLKIDIFEPNDEGLLQMMFLFFKQVIFRFQPITFQGVWFTIYQHGRIPRFPPSFRPRSTEVCVSWGAPGSGDLGILGSRWVHVSTASLCFPMIHDEL